MKPPQSGWAKRAHEAMVRCDKPAFDYALLRYSLNHSEEEADRLALRLFDLLPADARNWWMELDTSLPDIEESGRKLFVRYLAEQEYEGENPDNPEERKRS